MDNNMTNEEILKRAIKDSFTIKFNEGADSKSICESLSTQLYKFITKEPGFTSANVSRGMRDIVVEENRDAITLALLNIYFKYIDKNDSFKDKNDSYVKSILESSGNLDKLANTILSNKEMINRMRKSSCRNFTGRII